MDIVEFLKENDVEVWESGKNVARGWIGLQCPFCEDDSNHLGIRLKDNLCRCWKCGGKNLVEVIREVLNVTWKEAKNIATNISSSKDEYQVRLRPEIEDFKHEYPTIRLPKEASTSFPRMHLAYLKTRGFGVKTIKKYKLHAVYTIGPYKFRIIIPIICNKKIVSFTSRDVTGESSLKYLGASQKKYSNPKDFVYNLDSVDVGGEAILVEGPIDVWKLGDKAISFFGTSATANQTMHLYKKKIKRLYILMDNDFAGKKSATTLARALFPFVKEVNVVRLKNNNDPGELQREEAEILMRRLGLYS